MSEKKSADNKGKNPRKSHKKYENLPINIDGHYCFWQRMWGAEGALCCRFLGELCSDDDIRAKYEKRIAVPNPGLTKEEPALVKKLFKMVGLKDAKKEEQVVAILSKGRQDAKAAEMIEELARADFEKYGPYKWER